MTKTLVTFILDKSGSMSAAKGATIEAFNAYVTGLKEGGEDIDLTLIQFDSVAIEKTYVEKPIAQAPLLDNASYQPRGGTPLIDAVFTAIRALEAAIAKKTEKPKVVVCIQTDGQENASQECTWADLKKLVEEKQAEGWQFNFMGVGMDAYNQASIMGLSAAQTMSYDFNDANATREAFVANARNTRMYASGALNSTAYTTQQKQSAGDRFASPDPLVKTPQKPVKKEEFSL